ncbi:Protein PNS1 [Grifola frondosa]|uniref:Protein PNS1 n=1 Tax=Grifola frondosa TaxID=5627 RepID=A0A1C7M1D0_GRIFR|nr:Protein PNS1 [Grifola frondosa]
MSPVAIADALAALPPSDSSSSTNVVPTIPPHISFKCAVTDSKGPRRFMEDAHSIVVPFGGIRGQGFFAIFDGHAGKQAAEWCGQNFASYLLQELRKDSSGNIPDVLNATFHSVDNSLSKLSEESDGKMHSGCTAVTAFLRIEDADGKQSFLPSDFDPSAYTPSNVEENPDSTSDSVDDTSKQKRSSASKIKDAIKSFGSASISGSSSPDTQQERTPSPSEDSGFIPPASVRRVLYCANAGDARGVLCRAGRAVRLTYDHKGSDKQEAKRIMDAGGFVMSGRVNGVLAVTRSLGDSSMKEFVVGAPYTTETELNEEDEFLILACDGLWDVVDDQAAVELVRSIANPRKAAEELLDHAYRNYSSDNVTVLVPFSVSRALLVLLLGLGFVQPHFSSIHFVFTPLVIVDSYDIHRKSPFEGDRFKPKKRINDPIFLILFIAQHAGFAVLSVIVISKWVTTGGLGGGIGGGNTGNAVTLNNHTVILLLLVAAAGLVLSTVYLLLIRAFTKAIMHITLVLSILLNIGICVYYWITKYYSGAIIFTVIALFSVLAYFGYRSRIPLASLLLQVVMDVAKHHKSVYVVAFLALILQTAFSAWYTFTVIATYARYTPGNPSCGTGSSCSSAKVAGLIVYETFSFLWTSQVIGNVALATLSGGPFGSWYYFGPREQGMMPPHPTLSAFVRASTLSLGSIAFGSLIVTLLELLRMILNAARNSANADGHPIEACLAMCAECFVGCIEAAVQYFNRYAYIEISLYGKSYLKAARDTWHLFTDRGIDAIVNDSLVGMTLTWGAYCIGLLCSLFGYLYLRLTHPSYNIDGQYTAPVLLFAFLIGLQCSLTLSSAIEAGVSTIFVGLGEDPQVLAIRAPELFGLIASTYPQVVQGVPRV